MIIARAPFRLSFAGGGTDLPAYYEEFGGLVVSTAIDRYVYVMLGDSKPHLPPHLITSDAGSYLHAYRGDADTSGHMHLPWAVLDYFGVTAGVDLFVASQVPSGTGLGSSSALAVALIHAVSTYVGNPVTATTAAELACEIEIERLQSPIGKQDQYASALGGMNEIVFTASGVRARPLTLTPATRRALEARLMLFFTGARRNSGSILSHQQRASEERNPQTIESLHALKMLAERTARVLEMGEVEALGDLLHVSWLHKQRLTTGISTSFIDHCYATAREAGACGGKITGAGGGGFLLLDCPPERHDAVTSALMPLGLQPFTFSLEPAPAGVVAHLPTEMRQAVGA
jgi:D-glycero-alpha-D-manno-heptose-7-phosphate kinase